MASWKSLTRNSSRSRSRSSTTRIRMPMRLHRLQLLGAACCGLESLALSAAALPQAPLASLASPHVPVPAGHTRLPANATAGRHRAAHLASVEVDAQARVRSASPMVNPEEAGSPATASANASAGAGGAAFVGVEGRAAEKTRDVTQLFTWAALAFFAFVVVIFAATLAGNSTRAADASLESLGGPVATRDIKLSPGPARRSAAPSAVSSGQIVQTMQPPLGVADDLVAPLQSLRKTTSISEAPRSIMEAVSAPLPMGAAAPPMRLTGPLCPELVCRNIEGCALMQKGVLKAEPQEGMVRFATEHMSLNVHVAERGPPSPDRGIFVDVIRGESIAYLDTADAFTPARTVTLCFPDGQRNPFATLRAVNAHRYALRAFTGEVIFEITRPSRAVINVADPSGVLLAKSMALPGNPTQQSLHVAHDVDAALVVCAVVGVSKIAA
eukprot:TRINITY_DN9823_c2_g2_i1.p1 TRINITY_DN9823_c2_g2~~TRINITY_DN9823_c2_g2_i1.p1  ORF type:complete len:441 (+),score=70.46 TRINITY_DN9823_c2_g2_i1:80-1402(+)